MTGPHRTCACASQPLLFNPHDSGGWGSHSGLRRGKHPAQKEPEGLEPGAPSSDLHTTVRAGPTFRGGWGPRVKRTLLRVAQEDAGPRSPSPGAPGRENPLPAHCSGPSQVGSTQSVSAAAGAQGDAGRPGQAAPEPRSGAPGRSPTLETYRTNLSDSRMSLGLGATGTVAGSIAGV